MVAERRYRSASDAPVPASFVPTSSLVQTMAHPMLRGAQMAVIGGSVVRAMSAGLIGVSSVGETAIQVGNWCDRRRQTTPRERPPNALSSRSDISAEIVETPGKWAKKLVTNNASVDLAQSSATAQPVPIADQQVIAQLVLAAAQSTTYPGDPKADSIIQQQSGDISKLLGIMDNLTTKLDKVVAENLDLRQHMDKDFEAAEKKLEAAYNNRLINNTERILEEKNSEINKLPLQISKYNKDNDPGELLQ